MLFESLKKKAKGRKEQKKEDRKKGMKGLNKDE